MKGKEGEWKRVGWEGCSFFSIGLGRGGVGSKGFWEGVLCVILVVVCCLADLLVSSDGRCNVTESNLLNYELIGTIDAVTKIIILDTS